MRHTDIRTTLNVFGDVVTNEMAGQRESGGPGTQSGKLILDGE